MHRFRRPAGLAVVWVAATVLLSTVTWQVVGAAEDRVSDAPLSRLVAIPPASTSATSSPSPPETSPPAPDPVAPDPVAPDPLAPDPVAPDPKPTPSDPPPSAEPVVPAEPPTSTSAWSAETLVTEGGVVLFSYRPGALRLEAVSSVPGWSYDVAEESETRIEVRFAGRGRHTAVARAEWTDDGLSVDIDDDSDDD